MKVLVLYGSAHVGGSTDTLASRFLEGLAADPGDIVHFRPSKMAIEHCRACMHCAEEAGCVIDDDMREVYPALKASDVVVIAAPMFWGYMTSQLKTLFDRLEAAASHEYFGKKEFVLLLAYRHYYGSMVEWMNRITSGFGSSLSWIDARTYDPESKRDIPITELKGKLEEAFELGRRLRKRGGASS